MASDLMQTSPLSLGSFQQLQTFPRRRQLKGAEIVLGGYFRIGSSLQKLFDDGVFAAGRGINQGCGPCGILEVDGCSGIEQHLNARRGFGITGGPQGIVAVTVQCRQIGILLNQILQNIASSLAAGQNRQWFRRLLMLLQPAKNFLSCLHSNHRIPLRQRHIAHSGIPQPCR